MTGFLRACRAAAWLEYRQLRRHPVNLWLAAAGQLVGVGVWYFVARFLSPAADHGVRQWGGNYVAYVVVGVLLNQASFAALEAPFATISEAFWDKRLETYRLARHGIWANVAGRILWGVGFAAALQSAALAAVLGAGAFRLHAGVHGGLALATFGLLVLANAGIGMGGSSLFFLLEVKTGQDPLSWAYRYLIMLASGLYVPLASLPVGLRALGTLLPQTCGFAAMRALLLTGGGWADPLVRGNLLALALAAALALPAGLALLDLALRRAERGGGIGVVV